MQVHAPLGRAGVAEEIDRDFVAGAILRWPRVQRLMDVAYQMQHELERFGVLGVGCLAFAGMLM